MIFSSYRFIFAFFPPVCLVYHLLRRSGRAGAVKLWLSAASVVFYGLGQPDFVAVFALSLFLNYALLLGLDRAARPWARRGVLALAALWNLGLLVYFKYTNFFLQNINLLFGLSLPLISVALPIGISFFTFQIFACAVAVYRGERACPGLLDYTVFVTFFPQLIVGPVVRHEELLPQVEGDALLRFDRVNVFRGVMLFSAGCAKKILLANTLIGHAAAFYGGDAALATPVEAWAGVLAYVFAYYFDFSGYIDMARGLGCLFGVELPFNFDSPYKARNFADFWRRWNMTISRFFEESVFQNLFHFGDGFPKLIFATLATFALSGLWHGAGWHYIAWGLANGLLVCLANIRALRDSKPLPPWLGVLLTFCAGALVRVLFDSASLSQALAVYRRLFALGELVHIRSTLASALAFASGHRLVCLKLAAAAALCFFAPNTNRISEQTLFRTRDAVISGVLLGASLFFMNEVSTFLYFNF